MLTQVKVSYIYVWDKDMSQVSCQASILSHPVKYLTQIKVLFKYWKILVSDEWPKYYMWVLIKLITVSLLMCVTKKYFDVVSV